MNLLAAVSLALILAGCASGPEGAPPRDLDSNVFVPSNVTAEDIEHRCNGHFWGKNWKYPFSVSSLWYPSNQQVELVDRLLSTAIIDGAKSAGLELDWGYSNYRRQFIGFTSRGKRYIFAVGLLSGVSTTEDRPLTTHLFDLCGGGPLSWSAVFEVKSGQLVDTSFGAPK